MRVLFLSIVTFYTSVIEPRCFIGNRTHNVEFEVGTPFCSFEIHYTSDKCDSEPNVLYAAAGTPKNMDESFAKWNYTCHFTDLTTKCVCEGDNCNNITNAKLILAKEFSITSSTEISKIILCFLADGKNFGYFNLTAVTPAMTTEESAIFTTVTVETKSYDEFEKEGEATTTEMTTTETEIIGYLTTSLQTSGSGGPKIEEKSYYASEIRDNEPTENESAFQELLNNEVVFFCVFGFIVALLLLLISIFFTLTLSYVVKTKKLKSKEKTTYCES